MKDQMFFIFTILYLTCSAWITDHKAPFCSVDKGTQLLYQIDSEQAERYYFQQTTEKIENTDSLSVIHYTGTLWDKKRTVVIPSFFIYHFLCTKACEYLSAQFYSHPEKRDLPIHRPGLLTSRFTLCRTTPRRRIYDHPTKQSANPNKSKEPGCNGSNPYKSTSRRFYLL